MRKPQPFFKKSHQCWYVNLHGRQTRLDPDEKKAWEKYHALMLGEADVTGETPVIQLIAEFLEFSKQHHAVETHRWYKNHLKSFDDFIGNQRVGSLKPYHVERWIARRYPKTNNGSTLHGAMRAVGRVFSWAKKSGRLKVNPLEGMEKPQPTSRDVYLTPDHYKSVVSAIKDEAFRDFVQIMRETGCRPKEARLVEARHFDTQGKCWVFPKEEAKGKKEARIVLLNDRAFEITQRLALKHPTGPLFRNLDGEPWRKDSLNCRCHRLTRKLGFHVCCYAIRHTFATDAIVRGVDLVTISQLMGHKSLDMLHRFYQHVSRRSDHLREGLRKATEDDAA